jgi:hypothetical protein
MCNFTSELDASHRPGMTVNTAYTFSNGSSISLCFSSQGGTGRFLPRMNSGLNSFD